MDYRFLFVFFLSFTLAVFPALGQRHHFVSYSIQEGLAQSQVRDILQTEDGFLWIATVGGLSRFDGYRFKNYNKSNGLLSNNVHALFEKDGVLWLACEGGMVSIQNDSIQHFPFKAPFDNSVVFDIASFPEEDQLYLATNGQGLLVFADGEITQAFQGTSDQNFIRAIEIADGKITVGTKAGLFEWTNGQFSPLLENASVSSIVWKQNILWVATYDRGVWFQENGQWDSITIPIDISSDHTRDIAFDQNGRCWILMKHGMLRYAHEDRSIYDMRPLNEEVNINLREVMCDSEGNIWVGTDGLGILKYTGDAFEVYTADEEIVSDLVMDISQQADGSLWFATYGKGIMNFRDGNWDHYNYAQNLTNNTVWCVESTVNNEVWVGTSAGINIWNGETSLIRPFEFNDQLPFSRISSLYTASNGDIWIGTRDGIAIYTGDSLLSPEKLKDDRIRDVKGFIELEGKVWFSSSNGVFKYDPQRNHLENFNEGNGLPDNDVCCLSIDKLGNLWIGTDNGVALINASDQNFRNLKVSDNFSSNIVNFILADSKNRLWVGTDNGLFSLDIASYYSQGSITWRSYGEHQGMTSSECNQNAVFEDNDGFLWFGTNNGLFKLDTEDGDDLKAIIPQLYISRIELNYEPVLPENRLNDEGVLVFQAQENRMTFYFSALHFSDPERVEYSYRLMGSSDDWSPPSREDHITFANLSSGQYVFEVKARHSGNEWSEPIQSHELYIKPPFWFSWWFISLVILALSFSSYQVYLFRKKQRERKKIMDELDNKAKILGLEQQTLNAHMNRHFIFNALNSIQYYINTQDRKSANTYLTNFAHLVRKNLDSAQVDMIYLKDELDRLKLYLNLEQMRFSNRFVYELEVDPSIDWETVKVPSMILQPFVENSIMHGILPMEKKGLIHIGIKRRDDGMQLTIRDNGIGISESLKQKKGTSKHVSNGMRITRQRMELLKKMTGKDFSVIGPFELKDSLDDAIIGTEVRIVLPDIPMLSTPLLMN